MLLEQKIKIKLHGKGINHYLDKGYDISTYFCNIHNKYKVKRGTELYVNVKDLPLNSEKKVQYKCDICGGIYNIQYKGYITNCANKDMCKKCYYQLLQDQSKEETPNYNPNLEAELRKRRNYDGKIINWRKQVFIRDDYTCWKCGKKGGYKNAHHINPYHKNKELRYDVNNGITLCKECHIEYHSKYKKSNCNKETLKEFIMRIK